MRRRQLTPRVVTQLKHALAEIESPILRMYPPSDKWWASFRLLSQVIGVHNEEKCPICKSARSTDPGV